MSELERVLAASPAAGMEEWSIQVRVRLGRLRVALERHIANAEEDGGLFSEVINESPRLAHRVDRLRHDHVDLTAELAALARQLDEPAADDPTDVVRGAGKALLAHLAHHRYLGSNLVHEAYNVDIDAAD